jgi:putative polyketide hydroxylase
MPATPLPVLVAGAGTVGLSAALFLAHHGVDVLAVDRRDGPSPHPRATGIGHRTVELFHEVGIAGAVDAVAVDMSAGGLSKISAATLASADLRAVPPGPPPPVADPFRDVSPRALRGTCPQDRLDPVLLTAARDRGAAVRYSTRLVAVEQDDDGVTATLDGPDGREVVRAQYLVAADGARSDVRAALGIGTSGPGGMGRPKASVLFRADLTPHTGDARFVTCDIANPDVRGMLMTVDGTGSWILHVEYDPDAGEAIADFTAGRCRDLVRAAVGDPRLDVEVVSVLPWRVSARLADRFGAGRVFLAGDAAHTVPPIGAFGVNSGIADAHNLAWKLAAVLAGRAGPGLLDSYGAERRPVAALTLRQAMARLADPRLHWGSGPEVEAARAAAGVIAAPIVHLGYRYASAAVVDARPELPSTTDVALVLDGAPGSRLPHVPLAADGAVLSTLDLVRSGFTVLTGVDGEPWVRAAAAAAGRLGVEVTAHVISASADPGRRWPRAAGTGEDGALLVRPDGFVAWRAPAATADPGADLTAALAAVLARPLS